MRKSLTMDWVITHLLDLFSINRTHRAILEPAPSPSSDLVGSVGNNAHGQTHGSAIGAYDVQTLFFAPAEPRCQIQPQTQTFS